MKNLKKILDVFWGAGILDPWKPTKLVFLGVGYQAGIYELKSTSLMNPSKLNRGVLHLVLEHKEWAPGNHQ